MPFVVERHAPCAEPECEALVEAALALERADGMPLDAASLLRLRLMSFGPTRHALLLTVHHIVEDGLSLRLIVERVQRAYNAPASPCAPPASFQIKLEHEAAVCAPGSDAEAFWSAAVSGLSDARPLVPGQPPPRCNAT